MKSSLLFQVGPVSALSVDPPSVPGPETYRFKAQRRAIRTFTRIHLIGTGRLSVRTGKTPALYIKTEARLLPFVHTEILRGCLILALRPGLDTEKSIPLEYVATVPHLQSLLVAGCGEARSIGGPVRGEKLVLSVNGSGSIDLSVDVPLLEARVEGSGQISAGGRGDTVKAVVDGAGSVDVRGIPARSVSARVHGAGDVITDAADHLEVTISGSGTLRYRGAPRLECRVKGSGRICSVG